MITRDCPASPVAGPRQLTAGAGETSPRPSAASPAAAGLVSPPQHPPAAAGVVAAGGPGPAPRQTGEPAGTGRCRCGHLEMFHDIGKRQGRDVRTACSTSDGATATRCACTLYTPQETTTP